MFSIICVTWKNQKQCQELVDSIHENSFYKDHEIFVFHNEFCYPKGDRNIRNITDCHHHYRNAGFSRAVNFSVGYSEIYLKSKKQWICIIDDDSTVAKYWDKALIDAFEKTGSSWIASTRVEPKAPHYNMTPESYKKYGICGQPEWYHNISNVPLIIPTHFWKTIGGYDEDFPNVGAELGLAKRAYDHGERQFAQTPYSIAFHKQSQSMKRLKNIKQARIDRDRIFKEKYGISRQEFTKLIGKGEVYEIDSK